MFMFYLLTQPQMAELMKFTTLIHDPLTGTKKTQRTKRDYPTYVKLVVGSHGEEYWLPAGCFLNMNQIKFVAIESDHIYPLYESSMKEEEYMVSYIKSNWKILYCKLVLYGTFFIHREDLHFIVSTYEVMLILISTLLVEYWKTEDLPIPFLECKYNKSISSYDFTTNSPNFNLFEDFYILEKDLPNETRVDISKEGITTVLSK